MGWEEHVGHEKTTKPLPFDTARIDAYVAGIAETNPRHQAGPGRTAPPLVVAASIIPGSGSLLMDVGLGAKLARIVHGSIDIVLKRPIVDGDQLACTAIFDGIEEKSSGELVGFRFDVTDSAGESVADGYTRYFIRGKKKGGGSKAPVEDPGAPDHEVIETVVEGQSLLYAEGSLDRFPIHTNPDFARSVGLPDVILHGMCTLAFATRAVVDSVAGGDSARLRQISVRFSKMVFHGDALTTRMWVDGETVRFTTGNQKSELVLMDGCATVSA